MASALRRDDAGHAGTIRPNDGAPLDWLIAGFGPFARVARNPSGELARALGGQRRASHVFETAYGAVLRDIPRLAALKPRYVLMLGVAPRAKGMRVELLAINRRAMTLRDAHTALPATPLIEPGAAAFARGRHKGAVLVQRLRASGVRAQLSRDAGRYLCNFAYWQMLRALPDAKIVFIHIPLAHGTKRKDMRPGLAQMRYALAALMRAGL